MGSVDPTPPCLLPPLLEAILPAMSLEPSAHQIRQSWLEEVFGRSIAVSNSFVNHLSKLFYCLIFVTMFSLSLFFPNKVHGNLKYQFQ